LAACGDPYQAKAVYRLLDNEKFTAKAVLDISQQETVVRIIESGVKTVLVPQDTTAIDYSGLENTTGLGNIGQNKNSRGLMMHSAIAVGEDGQVFGLLSEKIWSRPPETRGKNHCRKSLPIEEKESYKWLEAMDDVKTATEELDGVQVIHLCDREGDMYELFAKAANEGQTFLCRRVQNRIVQDENGELDFLDEFIEKMPVSDTLDISVPRDSHTDRKARIAKLEIKFGKIIVNRPTKLPKADNLPEFLEVHVISAEEIDPPEDVKEPISWQLITNIKVQTIAAAVLCISWYTKRWKIETFHFTLKSGCAIEKLQEREASSLVKLIAL
jgi:hypothetical protein